jgi:uncharacterized protein
LAPAAVLSTRVRPALLKIEVDEAGQVSGILLTPETAFACLVLSHGAGAGMQHPFMKAVADGLCARGIATLRYQFPYMERGSKRPDTPPIAHATVRAAVAAAAKLAPGVPLLAGGKSFGGRMTSQAQAEIPLPNVAGLAFLGFPLHPAGKPSTARAQHLARISIPMLFLQGTHDALADQSLLTTTANQLPSARVHFFEDADHSFHVPTRSGRTDKQVLDSVLGALTAWAREIC